MEFFHQIDLSLEGFNQGFGFRTNVHRKLQLLYAANKHKDDKETHTRSSSRHQSIRDGPVRIHLAQVTRPCAT